MMNETAFRRIVYVGAGLVIITFLIWVFIVLPNIKEFNLAHSIPGNVVQFFQVVAVTHLIVAAAMIYTVRFSFQKGRNKNGFLTTAGIVLIISGLMLIGWDSDYLNHPDMYIKAVSINICCGLDFITGALSFLARYIRGHLPPVK
jgi:drug/metabolite transporter (DMT)-like permease